MTPVFKYSHSNPNKLCSATIEQIKRLGKDYQLFFFFQNGCSQSRALAATVNQFARIYGWTVWAISQNGSPLPEFPHPQKDDLLARRLSLKVFPALVAMHAHSKFYVPVSYGSASLDDIESELEILVGHEEWRRH